MIEIRDGLALSIEVSDRFFSREDWFYLPCMGSGRSGLIPTLQVFKQLGGRPPEEVPRQPRPSSGENPHTNVYRRRLDDFVLQVRGVAEVSAPVEQVGLAQLVEAAYRLTETGREADL
jgi:hypothetical protein